MGAPEGLYKGGGDLGEAEVGRSAGRSISSMSPAGPTAASPRTPELLASSTPVTSSGKPSAASSSSTSKRTAEASSSRSRDDRPTACHRCRATAGGLRGWKSTCRRTSGSRRRRARCRRTRRRILGATSMTLPPGLRLGTTRSSRSSARAAWARSTARATRGSGARSRSRSCRRTRGQPGGAAALRARGADRGCASHPNLLAIHDFGNEQGRALRRHGAARGRDASRSARAGPLAWRAAAEIALGVAEGLAAAHDRGVIHRDLKPANVFLTGAGQAKVLDFGSPASSPPLPPRPACSPPSTKRRAPGCSSARSAYMSPEQVRGEQAEAQSDIFALGCMLFEMLAGHAVFAGDSAIEVLHATLHREPHWRPPGRAGAGPGTRAAALPRATARSPLPERRRPSMGVRAVRHRARRAASAALGARWPRRLPPCSPQRRSPWAGGQAAAHRAPARRPSIA